MYVLVTVTLFIIQALLISLYFYLTWHHDYWRKRGLITAQPVSVLGHYKSIFTRQPDFLTELEAIYDKYKGEHRAVGVLLARQPKLLVLDPTLAHEVLVTNFSCYRDTITSSFVTHLPSTEDKYVRLNPFWAGGELWKRQRRNGQGGLTQSRVKQAYNIWQNGGALLLAFIEGQLKAQNGRLEMRNLSLRYAAHIMCDFIWGINTDALTPKPTGERCAFVDLASRWSTHAFSRKERFFATLMAPIVRKWCRMRNFPRDTDAFFAQLTSDAIGLRQRDAIEGKQKRTDYLNYLLQLREQKQLSHDDLVGLALTVLIDGYDTTGDALMRTVYYLASNTATQDKLRAEIIAELGDVGNLTACDFERLHSLRYLEQCIYESLRIGSLVEQYTRICTKPTSIALSEGRTVPIEPGTFVMVPIYQMHRDERFYAQPTQFKPERFDGDALSDYIKRGLLMPFGNGPRFCMGHHVAMLTLKSALVHICTHYELSATRHQKLPRNAKGFELFNGDIWLEMKPLSV